jgi:CRISPR-associated protein Cmr4
MYKGSFLLSFYAETPVHMGAGGSVSYVDLPVQRERHTSFPVLWGSGIKGVLRNFAYRKLSEEKVNTIFGPEDGGEEYSSCISITDAKILLYPVRSVRGVFAWITCPFVLKRFLEDLKAIKKDINISDITILDESKIIISKDSKLKIENQNKVALEEFVFNTEEKELNNLISFFEKVFPQNNPFKEDLEKHLAIVSDNVFKDFVNYAVEIRTRIRIDQDKGTVEKGALFSEELIPSESIFYSLVFISEPKKNNINFEEVKEFITQDLFKEDPLIQFGGDETTGKGFFRVKLFDNK